MPGDRGVPLCVCGKKGTLRLGSFSNKVKDSPLLPIASRQKPNLLWSRYLRGIVKTECDGTSAETRFGLPAKRTSPFISAGVSVQSSTGWTMFRVKLKTACYPLHSPLSPALLLPCVAVCHQIPFPLYFSESKSSALWNWLGISIPCRD